jgi:hypothetical protein
MTSVTITYCGLELFCTGEYTPGHPRSYYERNGDPGDPPDPPEFDFSSIKIGDIEAIDFFGALEEKSHYDIFVDLEDRAISAIEEANYRGDYGEALE